MCLHVRMSVIYAVCVWARGEYPQSMCGLIVLRNRFSNRASVALGLGLGFNLSFYPLPLHTVITKLILSLSTTMYTPICIHPLNMEHLIH